MKMLEDRIRADGIVTKEIDAIRIFRSKRKNIDNASSYCILPRLIHIIHMLKPIAGKHFCNKLSIHMFTYTQLQCFISQFFL